MADQPRNRGDDPLRTTSELTMLGKERSPASLGETMYGEVQTELHEGHPEFAPGTVLAGRFRLVRRLGQGGVGSVWEAIQLSIDRRVALKIMHADADERLRPRFMKEAKLAARIHHPNVVEVLDLVVLSSGQPFIVMEFLEGVDLLGVLEQGGALTWMRAKPLLLQVLEALSATHARGIVHRDIKPENVFVLPPDAVGIERVKLVDYGFAKSWQPDQTTAVVTRSGEVLGTPSYISPEQLQELPLDWRVDLYAFGALMYFVLCGRRPFVADSLVGLIKQHMYAPPPPLESLRSDSQAFAGALQGVIHRAMAKDRDLRFQSADELARALRAIGPGVEHW